MVADGRTGLLVEPGRPEAFAAAIDALLSDGVKRQNLSTAARRFVSEERSLPVIAGRLESLLVSALEYPL